MSSLHHHPSQTCLAVMPPYVRPPYVTRPYITRPYVTPPDVSRPTASPQAKQTVGDASAAQPIPFQRNSRPGSDPENSRWVSALSGKLGEIAQQEAYGGLATYLTSTLHHYLLLRQPNLQWLSTLEIQEIEALAKDLAQVCLVKLSRDEHALLAKYSGLGAFKGWVTQIALNIARSELRKAPWERNHPLDSFHSIPDLDSPTPEGTLMQSQLASVLHRCLDQLPDHYQTVLVRCVMHGERTESVARDLGRTSQAVYNLVSRAKKALGLLLAEAGVDKGDLAFFEMV